MFAVALIAIVVVVVAVRLMVVVRSDRSLSPPRSHTHAVDQHSARLFRIV
jgi:hypothetical protein